MGEKLVITVSIDMKKKSSTLELDISDVTDARALANISVQLEKGLNSALTKALVELHNRKGGNNG